MIDGLGRGFVHGTTPVGAHGRLEGRLQLRRTRRTRGIRAPTYGRRFPASGDKKGRLELSVPLAERRRTQGRPAG